MEPREYFNTTEENTILKKYNIIVPICLGNKFFSEKGIINENVEKYLDWSLEHTKRKVLILVVDKIQDTNYFVRNHHSSERSSLSHVLKDGQVLKQSLERLINTLPSNKRDMIDVAVWEDYLREDAFCGVITHTVYKEFKNNSKFRNAIIDVVNTSVTDRMFSEKEYFRLCDYVLDEFSVVYSGAVYNDEYFGMYVYPRTDSVVHLIKDIKKGIKFPTLKEKLPQEKIALVILN